jgi:hypothetical protein
MSGTDVAAVRPEQAIAHGESKFATAREPNMKTSAGAGEVRP